MINTHSINTFQKQQKGNPVFEKKIKKSNFTKINDAFLAMKKIIILILLFFSIIILNARISHSQNTVDETDTYRDMNNSARDMAQEGKYFQALERLHDALKLGEKIFNEKKDELGVTFYYLGLTYNNIGNYDQAIYYGNLAEKAFISNYHPNHRLVAYSYTIIGNAYRGKQDYIQALEYYKRHLNILLLEENPDLSRIASVNYSIAEVLYQSNKYEEAIALVKKNIRNASYYEKIDYYALLAAIYVTLEDYDSSKSIHMQAIDFLGNMEDSEEDLAYEYISYADLLVRIKDFDEAEKYLDKASEIFTQLQILEGEIISYYYIVKGYMYENLEVKSVNFDIGEKNQRKIFLEKSITEYNKSLEALNFPTNISNYANIQTIQSLNNLDAISVLSSIAQSYHKIANLYEDINDNIFFQNISQSIDYHNFIGNFIIRLRKEITGDENKILLTGIQESSLKEIIQVAYKAYQFSGDEAFIELAFQNAEQLKSGSVFEKLMDEFAKDNSLIPQEIREKESLINSKLASYTLEKYNIEQSSDTADSKRGAILDSLILQTTRENTEFLDSLEHQYPGYYQNKYNNQPLSLQEIQSKLKSDETLIEYSIYTNDSISELYTFVISPSEKTFVKQDLSKEFFSALGSVYGFVSDRNYQFITNADAIDYVKNANELYKILIQPIKNKIINAQIILIPDGELNYIPFDALIAELPDTSKNISFNKLEYLIKNYQINYSYSANLMYAIPRKNIRENKSILAFAPEYNNDSIDYNGEKLQLLPLPGTQREVQLISEYIDTKSFTGKQASVANFLNNYQQHDILHLAMHAILNDSLPNLSRFVFTQQPDHNSKLELYTADIYNLDLNHTKLAVLSACNTGSGKIQKGEGVMSVSRGFLYAGCPSIIMTLWEAEDQSGTKIMYSFYKYLKKGYQIDKALRQAKLDYLETENSRFTHPHYWLAYISIGDNSPIFKRYDYFLLSLIVLVLLGIVVEQKLRRRRKIYKG